MFRLSFAARFYATEAARMTYDKETLMRLRKATGYSFQNCRRAVEKFGDDPEKAEKWLHETAVQEGWSKMSAVRKAANGLIGVYKDGKFSIMIEMNCETDFVARTDKFRGLVARVCQEALKNQLKHILPVRSKQCDKWAVNMEAAKHIEIDGRNELVDYVASAAGQLGEKVVFNKATCLSTAAEDVEIFGYAHPRSAALNGVLLGQIGTLIALSAKGSVASSSATENEKSNLSTIGAMLCQHVIGMNPTAIGSYEKPTSTTEKSADSVDEEGATILSDETELLKQDFLIQPSMKVGEFLDSKNCRIYDFIRFKCGENDEK